MQQKRKIEETREITITVTHYSDNSAQVSVEGEDIRPIDFMCATEFMIWSYAHQCEAPFEEILRALCVGARTYKSAVVTMPQNDWKYERKS